MIFKFSSLYITLRRIIDLSPLSNRLHLLTVLIFILSLHGCAGVREVLDELQLPSFQDNNIEQNDFFIANGDDVIGRLASVRIKKGDTLPDIARHFSLGINTVSAANPEADIWVPEAGGRILLPLSFILPDTPRKGIVINLAAMRLFYYKKDGNLLAVSTYPVGIGSTEQPTPMGRMYIRRKKIQPTWYVPASIAEEHRKKGDQYS